MNKARLNDIGIGICTCHKNPTSIVGTIYSSSFNKNTNSMGNAKQNDIVICTCGHISTLSVGSMKYKVNNMSQIRNNDTFTGCATGTISVGSFNTNVM